MPPARSQVAVELLIFCSRTGGVSEIDDLSDDMHFRVEKWLDERFIQGGPVTEMHRLWSIRLPLGQSTVDISDKNGINGAIK